MTDLEAANRRVAEWLGITWHKKKNYRECSCGEAFYGYAYPDIVLDSHLQESNPNFATDPLALLRLLEEKELLTEAGIAYYPPAHGFIEPDTLLIPIRYLKPDGALLKVFDEWIRRKAHG